MDLFSKRRGLIKVSETIQVDSMSIELRNSLWSVLCAAVWSQPKFFSDVVDLSRSLWLNFFKLPIDTAPYTADVFLDRIRIEFFRFEWYRVYDFLEFVVRQYGNQYDDLKTGLNYMLERELSAYIFVGDQLTNVTDKSEVESLECAINDGNFSAASAHLKRALELYSNRENPDYRNSIKESISAVESMAITISGKSKASLNDALAVLEKKNGLHSALKGGFVKLYAYTSDAGGIRHAMLEEPSLSQADAKFFLLSCTSFVNYLKSNMK